MKTPWPPEAITINLSQPQAAVLYDLLVRYHESEKPELTTTRTEWRALVLLLGELERNGAAEIVDTKKLEQGIAELGDYDAFPF